LPNDLFFILFNNYNNIHYKEILKAA